MQGQPMSATRQAVLCLLCGIAIYFLNSIHAYREAIWFFGFIAAVCFCKLLYALYLAWQYDRVINTMQTPTGIYGASHSPTVRDLEKAGLKTSNKDGNGIPLAYKEGKILYYDGPGHISIRAATNAGKTESSSANICFALGKHRNLICTAKGAELAWLCGYQYRQKVLGQQVIVINPWGKLTEHGLPNHHFNPIGHLVDLAKDNDPELIDACRKVAYTLASSPEGKLGGDGLFFLQQARDWLTWSLAFAAILENETGELCCNIPYIYNVTCGSDTDIRDFLLKMSLCEEYEGTIKRAGERNLKRMETSPKTAESILSEAQNALQIFDPSGPLGKSMVYSDFDPKDLKNPDKPTSAFIVIPPEKISTHGQAVGLILEVLTDICIKANSFEPRVTIVADEFANISKGPLPSILPVKYVGRSLGVQLITYVQDTESYKRYGNEASAFTTQAEVMMAWAIRSTKDAKEYSERSGKISVVTENSNVPFETGQSSQGRYSIGLSEKSIPAMRPDEFLQLPDFTAALFYKQQPVTIVNLLSYRIVDPWWRYARAMPGSPSLKKLPIKFKL